MRAIEFEKSPPPSHTKEHEEKEPCDVPPSCIFVWLRGGTFPFLPIFCLALLVMLAAVRADADDPRLVIEPGGHTAMIRQILFTRDGKYLVSAGDDKVICVWQVATGTVVRTIQGQIGSGNEGKIYAAALSRDERYLAVGAFTWAVLEGLRGDADVTKKDGLIYVDELGSWVIHRVKELTGGNQHAIYEPPPGFHPFPIFAIPKR